MEVSKLVKSKEVSDEHPLNKPFILVTFEVTILVKSKEVSDEHPENILNKVELFVVSKLARFISILFEQEKPAYFRINSIFPY